MASKSKLASKRATKKSNKDNIYLVAIPLLAFVIKLITMANIPSGGWLGADGESYLSGVDALLKHGYFSDESVLSYWPAGYPILIWLIAKISIVHAVWLLSFLQSAFYAFASYYFVKQFRDTRLRPYILLIGLALAFNPTLSLNSLAIGYESPIASCMLMIVGIIIKSRQAVYNRKFGTYIVGVGGFSALATFMQPRWVLTSVVIAFVWVLMYKNRKIQAAILAGVIGLMAIAPAILIQRNIQSIDKAIISTNLSAALLIGTGPETTGGYDHVGPNIQCGSKVSKAEPSDTEFMICAAKWYLTNPLKTLKLTWSKSLYFWSPWSGPRANGTMARNPWLKIDPLTNIAKGSQQGHKLVYGTVGEIFSWLWIAGEIFLLFYGFVVLKRLGKLEANLSYLLLTPILASWLSAVATIGDHRFRIPTMSLSLTLQMIALKNLSKKIIRE